MILNGQILLGKFCLFFLLWFVVDVCCYSGPLPYIYSILSVLHFYSVFNSIILCDVCDDVYMCGFLMSAYQAGINEPQNASKNGQGGRMNEHGLVVGHDVRQCYDRWPISAAKQYRSPIWFALLAVLFRMSLAVSRLSFVHNNMFLFFFCASYS